MKNYEKPEIKVTSYEASDNMMLTTSAGVQSTFDTNNTWGFGDLKF